jgi:hypothetical protein
MRVDILSAFHNGDSPWLSKIPQPSNSGFSGVLGRPNTHRYGTIFPNTSYLALSADRLQARLFP